MSDRVFAALADPTRRAVLERIAERPQSVGALAAQLPVSRIYHIDPQGLGPVRRWLDEQWERSLENFRKLAAQEDDQ